MGLIIGGVSASDLVFDGQSVSLYEGGNPPVKLWPTIRETVQITLGTNTQARDQFRDALTARGLSYMSVKIIPFDIELVGTGSTQNMFYGCRALTSAPAMDTSRVTNMNSMFAYCRALTSAPAMDTSSVTNMNQTFRDCRALTSVPDLTTGQVTNMGSMFRDCSSLTDGNVLLIGRHPNVTTTDMILNSGLTYEPFNTVQITLGTGLEAREQFRAALSARGLEVATVTEIPFDIELVGSGAATQMFYNCQALTKVPAMNTSGVTSMKEMFRACASLTSLPDMDTGSVTSMEGIFTGCSSLTHVPDMDTSQVTNMGRMFYSCSSLTAAPEMGTSKVTNMVGMFTYCSSLTSVPDMYTSQVTDMDSMFYDCSALTDGNVRLIGRHPSVNTDFMIDGSGLTREPFLEVVQITLGTGNQARDQFRAALTERGLDYRTVTEIPLYIELVGSGSTQDMFNGCAALTSVPAMDTSQVTNMSSMFAFCSSLTSVPVMDTSQVTTMTYMFNRCSSLTSVPAMNTSRVTDMRYMFLTCTSLTHAPDLDTSSATTMNSIFSNCAALTYVPDMVTGQATDLGFMFYNCSALTDGNVRLIGRHPNVNTTNIIAGSGLTREPFLEVVQITLGATTQARDQLRAALADRGLDYQTVTEIPFAIELIGTGSARDMFNGCSALKSVPDMDTSSVTTMSYMFNGCSSLTSVPAMDTSNATTLRTMFQNCTSLTYVPDLQASNVADVSYLFYRCSALTDGNVRLIGKHPSVSTTSTIALSGLTRIPFYDTAGNPIPI